MLFTLRANTPQEAIDEVAAYYTREARRLWSREGWATGKEKKEFHALAQYAERQEKLWREMTVEPSNAP